MKKYLILLIILFFTQIFAQNVELDISIDKHWPAPEIIKPDYLQPITDPTFGCKITRITGNPGEAIPNISNTVWADSILRHGYSKRQPWNSDMSMIYLNKHYPNLWLDGETYEVLFTRTKPSSRVRWSHTEPNIMMYIMSGDSGAIGRWDVVEDTTKIVISFGDYESCTFGDGEGNFTDDGTKVAVLGTRKSDNRRVIFVVDVENRTKGNDIEFSSDEIVNNCTISSLGNYIVVGGNFGNNTGDQLTANDRLKVFNAITGELIWEETGYGMPSHFDTQIDQDGNEIIAGVAKSAPYNGWVIKRNLANGDTVLVSVYPGTEATNNSYATHTSGRALNRPGWVFVTHQTNTDNRAPYINEVVAVKLDGSRVERIAHMHQKKVLGTLSDRTEAQAVPSPDGLRVMWASNWINVSDTVSTYPVQSYIADYRDKVYSNNKYSLITNTNGTGTGNLSVFPNAEVYDDGSVVTVMAVPEPGSEFAGWSGDVTGTENPLALTMDSDKNITAIFKVITTVTASVIAGTDDVEEKQTGSLLLTSNDLELINDGVDNDQTVGIRFVNLDLPQNAEILNAYIKFTATGNSYGASLDIRCEDTDSSITFVNTLNNVTNRNTTSSSVHWNTTDWVEGQVWETPNLRWIVQEVVDRSGWKSGNALSFIISGTGKSRAYSFDSDGTPPVVVVKYALPNYTLSTTTDGAGNIELSPSGGMYLENESVTLTAVPENGYQFDGWSGDISGTTNPTTIIMDSDKNVSATFSQILNGTIDVSINSTSDDAEEYANGDTKLASPDLELVNDGVDNDQIIGMRFSGINIPHGAIVTNAYVEFTAKDNTDLLTSLQFSGEDVDSSATFVATANNISDRVKTSAKVNWLPEAWIDGTVEKTPQLASIVQEIINRSNWKSGNALTIIVNGSGKRRAWSFDGTGTPPKLHIEYSLDNTAYVSAVSYSSDDAEEYANGDTKLSSPDLELVNDGVDNDQTIGIRFANITIPKGVTILSAYIEFTARDNLSGDVVLTLKTEDVDNSQTFMSTTNNITNRITSNSSVSWYPNVWEDGKLYQTPELKTMVQEVISRNGWASGNALSFIISGTGKRRAWSFDGTGTVPKLHIIYKEADINLVFQVNNSNDDAEEYADGTMRITSSDLELVDNGTDNKQTVGIRFPGITIPKEATIINAYLEFVAKDSTDRSTSLSIKTEDVNNASVFTSTNNDITTRITTDISVNWEPEPWSASFAYQTPELKTLVQNMVERDGWTSGNAISFIISGSGQRRAWSFDGDGKAPKLYVKYSGNLGKESNFTENNLPCEYSLSNYPNPFNPSTNIVFNLPKSSHVKIDVYDILGRRVAKLINDVYEAGNYKFNWLAKDENGNVLSSGIYIVRIEAGSFIKSIKLMLLR